MREVGVILIASFAIDRMVTGLFFLLSFHPDLRAVLDPDSLPDPAAKEDATRLCRLIYAVCAGYLSIVIVAGMMGIRLSKITGLELDPNAGSVMSTMLDVVVTGLLLIGGADRLAEALKLYGGKESKPQAPIEITGKVVLEQGAVKLERAGN